MPKHVWPVHPQPLPDELFSSWICRAAHMLGQKPTSLLSLVDQNIKSFSKHIDSSIPISTIKSLAYHLNTDESKAIQTTLWSMQGYLFETMTSRSKRAIGILNTGETSKDQYFQQYCPLCLKEEDPYFRRLWRISFFTVCPRHRCQLKDSCPQCDAPVMFFKNDLKHKFLSFNGKITECYHCGCDICSSDIDHANNKLINDATNYQNVLQNGYISLTPKNWTYSFSMFCVLRHMMRLLHNIKFQRNGISVNEIDTNRTTIRYQLMQELIGVFNNWPSNFIDICKTNRINYSDLTSMKKTTGIVPFWLSDSVKNYIYTPNIEPSRDSIISAINVMKSRNMRVNTYQLNRFMGYHDSSVIKLFLKDNAKNKPSNH